MLTKTTGLSQECREETFFLTATCLVCLLLGSVLATNTDSSAGFVLPEFSQAAVLVFQTLVSTRDFL